MGIVVTVSLSSPTYVTWVGKCGNCMNGMWSGIYGKGGKREWQGQGRALGGRCGAGEKLPVSLELFSFQMVAPPSLLVSERYFI